MASDNRPLRRDKLAQFLGDHRSIRKMEKTMEAVSITIPATLDQLVRKDTLTARGDLFVRNATTVARLALGASGRVLQSNGTDAMWQQLTSASISDFTEAAQDAVGAALADTPTIDLNYDDATPAISATIVTDSVVNTLLANMADSTIKGRASGAGSGDPTDLTAAQVAAIVATAVASALNLSSGTYTPTLTGVTNIDSVTDLGGRYIRLGNIVFVSGAALIDATAAAAATEVGISLPFASTLGSDFVIAGSASANAILQPGAILGDNANDRARLQFVAQSAAAQVMWWTFAYLIV